MDKQLLIEKVKNNWPLIALGGLLLIILSIGYGYSQFTKFEYEERIRKLETEHDAKVKSQAEQISKLTEEKRTLEAESSQKITSLQKENKSLKTSKKETIYKIVKPDGTIIEKKEINTTTDLISELITDVRQEFNEKIKEIENRYVKVHQERVLEIKEEHRKEINLMQDKISRYESGSSVNIGTERTTVFTAGAMTDERYYISVSRDIIGPFGIGVTADSSGNMGAGLTFRF